MTEETKWYVLRVEAMTLTPDNRRGPNPSCTEWIEFLPKELPLMAAVIQQKVMLAMPGIRKSCVMQGVELAAVSITMRPSQPMTIDDDGW